MKKLLFLIPLLFVSPARSDTRTPDDPHFIIISTGIADSKRSYGDKLNENFEIAGATMATILSDVSVLKTSTGSLDSRTTAVELEVDALNAGQVNASSYTLQGNSVNLSTVATGVNALLQGAINASSYTLQGNAVNLSTVAQGVNQLMQYGGNPSSATLQGNTVNLSTTAQGVNALNQAQVNASSYTLQGNAVNLSTVASGLNNAAFLSRNQSFTGVNTFGNFSQFNSSVIITVPSLPAPVNFTATPDNSDQDCGVAGWCLDCANSYTFAVSAVDRYGKESSNYALANAVPSCVPTHCYGIQLLWELVPNAVTYNIYISSLGQSNPVGKYVNASPNPKYTNFPSEAVTSTNPTIGIPIVTVSTNIFRLEVPTVLTSTLTLSGSTICIGANCYVFPSTALVAGQVLHVDSVSGGLTRLIGGADGGGGSSGGGGGGAVAIYDGSTYKGVFSSLTIVNGNVDFENSMATVTVIGSGSTTTWTGGNTFLGQIIAPVNIGTAGITVPKLTVSGTSEQLFLQDTSVAGKVGWTLKAYNKQLDLVTSDINGNGIARVFSAYRDGTSGLPTAVSFQDVKLNVNNPPATTSTVAVNGIVESSFGGFKLPDGTLISSSPFSAGGGDVYKSSTQTFTAPQTIDSSVTIKNGLTVSTGGIAINFDGVAGESLHIQNGNILIKSTEPNSENEIRFHSNFPTLGKEPQFRLGRISTDSVGEYIFHFYYSTPGSAEKQVFEFDSAGIVASRKLERGSHFEGFISTATNESPVFRLNSWPEIRLEMGGGQFGTDTALSRPSSGTLSILSKGTTVFVQNSSSSSFYTKVAISTDGNLWANLTLDGGNDQFMIRNFSDNVDEKQWLFKAKDSALSYLTANDNFSSFREWFRVVRSGVEISSITFPMGEVKISSLSVWGTLTTSGTVIASSSTITDLTVGIIHGDGSGLSGISGFNPSSTQTITATYNFDNSSTTFNKIVVGSNVVSISNDAVSFGSSTLGSSSYIPVYFSTSSATSTIATVRFGTPTVGICGSAQNWSATSPNLIAMAGTTKITLTAIGAGGAVGGITMSKPVNLADIGTPAAPGITFNGTVSGIYGISAGAYSNVGISVNAIDKMRITAWGVGIGTSVPMAKFAVAGGSIAVTGNNAGVFIGTNSVGGAFPTPVNGVVLFSTYVADTQTAELWVIDSAGNMTQISPHASIPPSMDWGDIVNPIVLKSSNKYAGTDDTINISAMAKLIETMAHKSGDLPADKKLIISTTFKPESWGAKEDALEAQTNAGISAWEVSISTDKGERPLPYLKQEKPERVRRAETMRAK